MNRIDRLTAILIQLQSKRVVKAQEIADRFGISLRTVYRDVWALEEAGVPIGAEAGIGYFLEDYHLPPVMFSNEEASALLFGAKLVSKMADELLHESFESALYKIKSVLKRSEKEHLEDLGTRERSSTAAVKNLSLSVFLTKFSRPLCDSTCFTLIMYQTTNRSHPARSRTHRSGALQFSLAPDCVLSFT